MYRPVTVVACVYQLLQDLQVRNENKQYIYTANCSRCLVLEAKIFGIAVAVAVVSGNLSVMLWVSDLQEPMVLAVVKQSKLLICQ
jgi:hypothetical protein